MNIVYLQCDMRYNAFLLRKLGDTTVVEYVVEKCKKLRCYKIVAGIFECEENVLLVEKLKEAEVEVILSKGNVTERFIKIVSGEKADFCVRICGDQALFDVEETLHILNTMKNTNKEFYYEEYNACILPDIVSVNCVKKNKDELIKCERYFYGLIKNSEVSRYSHKPLLIMYNFRVNSNEGYRVCSNIINNSLNIYELSRDVAKAIIKSDYLCNSGILGSWIIPTNYYDFYYDEAGDINPWIGKSILDFIKPHLTKDMCVFEWGMGNSTLFWSKYVKKVVSVEYNKDWYEKIDKIAPMNVKTKYYQLEYGGDYCKSILEEKQKFDIIFIDGRDRVRCAKNAVLYLKENGLIIWDNVDREYYKEGIDFLTKEGFKNITLSSIIYGNPGGEDYTAIFYKRENLLNL